MTLAKQPKTIQSAFLVSLIWFVEPVLGHVAIGLPPSLIRSGITFDHLITYLTQGPDCWNLHCSGYGCQLITSDQKDRCPFCVCQTGSPARGCDRMPLRLHQFLENNGCPDVNITAQTIMMQSATTARRWYRKIDKSKGIDECQSYRIPLCRGHLELNLWRSPESKEECNFFCFPKKDSRTFVGRPKVFYRTAEPTTATTEDFGAKFEIQTTASTVNLQQSTRKTTHKKKLTTAFPVLSLTNLRS